MIDEGKRRALIIAGIVFGVLVIISIVIGVVVAQQNSLPPKESETPPPAPSTNTEITEPSVATSNSETTAYDILFKGFSSLEQKGITVNRISGAYYYLSEYAKTTGGQITSYTLDQASLTQDLTGELKKTRFKVTANTNEVLTVEISYVYSADNFIQIFDSTGKLIQSSPTEAD
jgi:hypothetical protein